VPRHPQRFDAVRGLLRRRGVRFVQRSTGRVPDTGHDVYLVDTLGELQVFYAGADIALSAAAWCRSADQPARAGGAREPILSGPHAWRAEIADVLGQCGALTIVRDTPNWRSDWWLRRRPGARAR
jgi:3-deoxy-D-manno-octulosonic-acid transferase